MVLGKKDGVRGIKALTVNSSLRQCTDSVNTFQPFSQPSFLGNTTQLSSVSCLPWDNSLVYGPGHSEKSDQRKKRHDHHTGATKGKSGALGRVPMGRVPLSPCTLHTSAFFVLTQCWAHRRYSINKYYMERGMK